MYNKVLITLKKPYFPGEERNEVDETGDREGDPIMSALYLASLFDVAKSSLNDFFDYFSVRGSQMYPQPGTLL